MGKKHHCVRCLSFVAFLDEGKLVVGHVEESEPDVVNDSRTARLFK
jgi:hypothetical protein